MIENMSIKKKKEAIMTKDIERTLNKIYKERLKRKNKRNKRKNIRGGELNENKKRSSYKKLDKSI